MNNIDRQNLMNLLAYNKEEFDYWFRQSTEFEREYAKHILAIHREELAIKAVLLVDKVTDLSEANKLLQKFRL